MAMFRSGSFTTSTPIHKEQDGGFYENSPLSRNLSQTSARENSESSYLPLRKNLFGKRTISQNIPDDQFSHKHRLLLSRSSTFSRRNASSNKETPRASRISTSSDKPVHSASTKNCSPPPPWLLHRSKVFLKQLDDDDSGFCEKTFESPKADCYGSPLLPLIENLHQRKETSKEKSLAYFKDALKFSGAKSCADLSASEMKHLYSIYRFQRMGLKPSSAGIAFCEKRQLMEEENEESEMFLSSWKDKLEHISASLNHPPEIDFLSRLHKINAYSIVSNIFVYLSGSDLQNASCVDRLWRKLILEDKGANRTRQAYLLERRQIMKEMEKKKLDPFRRPSNFRILGSIENIGEQLLLKKTIKEINFEAFIEVGKSGKKHKPLKCPSCANLSLQNEKIITKYDCLFCGYAFCCNCFKPYSNWHICGSSYSAAKKPPANGKKYLRRL